MVKDEYIGIERGDRGLSVDDMVTVVIYKSNTFNDFLRENSGLLLLTGVFTLILNQLNKWKFNKKMKKETNEEFREVFTYPNFKKILVENQQMKL